MADLRETGVGEPAWLAIARRYLGAAETAGPASNPTITGFFRRAVGRIYADETPWCAAFVGACLAEAGMPGSGSLLARSYLDYGMPIDKPRYGCIVVLSRGGTSSASSWQGHVGFYLGEKNGLLAVLGGNQGNAVTVQNYPAHRLLGCRWPSTSTTMPRDTTDIRHLQQRLVELGYHETGSIDGVMGRRTRAALLAFKADNGLDLTADIDNATHAALGRRDTKRPVAPERAAGAPSASRIIANSRRNIATSAMIGAGSLIAGADPILAEVEQAAGLAGRLAAVLRSFATLLSDYWPLMVLAGTTAIIMFSGRAIIARLADHRSGKTP